MIEQHDDAARFEADPEIAGQIEAVYALTSDLGRGQILLHSEIEAVLNTPPHTGRWGHVVRKVRKRLEEERGIATWPDRLVGYRLCSVEEQLHDLPRRRLRRALRQSKRGRLSADAIPGKSLSAAQKRSRIFVVDQTREMERALRKSIRVQTALLTPRTAAPRAPRMAPCRVVEAESA
jgi:hypothetical protein